MYGGSLQLRRADVFGQISHKFCMSPLHASAWTRIKVEVWGPSRPPWRGGSWACYHGAASPPAGPPKVPSLSPCPTTVSCSTCTRYQMMLSMVWTQIPILNQFYQIVGHKMWSFRISHFENTLSTKNWHDDTHMSTWLTTFPFSTCREIITTTQTDINRTGAKSRS